MLTTIAEYALWGVFGFFVLIILGVGFLLLKNRTPVEPKKKKENIPEENKFRSAGTKKALILDKKDRRSVDKEKLVSNLFSSKQQQETPVKFNPTGGASREKMDANLQQVSSKPTPAASRPDESFNPFGSDEEELLLEHFSSNPKPPVTPKPSQPGNVAPPPVVKTDKPNPFALPQPKTNPTGKPQPPKPFLPPPPGR